MDVPLSPGGVARKEAMLRLLQARLRARARRIRVYRTVAFAGALLVALRLATGPQPAADPIAAPNAGTREAATPELSRASSDSGQPDHHKPGQTIVRPGSGALEGIMVDDEELLRFLKEANEPPQIARVAGRVVLVGSVYGE